MDGALLAGNADKPQVLPLRLRLLRLRLLRRLLPLLRLLLLLGGLCRRAAGALHCRSASCCRVGLLSRRRRRRHRCRVWQQACSQLLQFAGSLQAREQRAKLPPAGASPQPAQQLSVLLQSAESQMGGAAGGGGRQVLAHSGRAPPSAAALCRP
jgi:hypothetical protein